MPITHTTIPVPPAQVGQTEWAEEHTLPTAGEIGALTTASAEALFLTPDSASAVYARQVSAITTAQLATELAPYLTSASASTVYAREVSAVTTAQLGVYLLSQDASTTYARQTSAVTTAQLGVYLLSQDASTTYARQTSAVTTAQLGVYLLSQDASTTYARQTSAVTTAQLGVYLLANDASTTYARQASAVTTAQLSIYLTSASAAAAYASIGAITSVVNITEASADLKYGKTYLLTTDVSAASTILTTVNELICSISASVAYKLEYSLIYRSSATTTGFGVGVSVTPTPSPYACMADIYGFGADGTGGTYVGYASANGDMIVATSTNAAAIDLPCYVICTFVAGATGQAQLVIRSEVSNSNVLIRRGSSLRMLRLGAV